MLELLEHWTPEMQCQISVHSYGWGVDRFDFRAELQASAVRFYKAYRSFVSAETVSSVCDVGGFWGVFPVTLARLGFEVTMTESLRFYRGAFDKLFGVISREGVRVVDYDPFQPESSAPERFDVVTVMAVLEHYPHSLKTFMQNVTSLLEPKGIIYFEVPNIVFLPKRIKFLLGRSPLSPIEVIFNSEVPFIGHHHEFTISELRDLARLSGLVVLKENYYDYSIHAQPFLKRMAHRLLQIPGFLGLRDSRECLAIMCKRQNEGRSEASVE